MDYSLSTYDGMEFRYASVGEGTPVVLLHGFPDTPDSWTTTADALAAAGYRALVPFLRGYHHDSIVPGRDYRSDTNGEDVWNFLNSVDITSAALVGHDFGASCVYSAYRQAPHRCLALSSIAIPHPATLKPSAGTAFAARHFAYFKLPGSSKRAARGDFKYIKGLYQRWAPDWTGPERDAALQRALEQFRDPAVFHNVIEWYRDLELGPNPKNDFRIKCPGLIVAGSEDFGITRQAWDATCRRFDTHAELLYVDGAGHWPHRVAEDDFHAALIQLMGSIEV